METSFLSVLPNLSIGVIAVLSLVYVSQKFIGRMKEMDGEHATNLREREEAMRKLEREIRESIMGQLGQNTQAMTRVMDHINSHK